MTTTTTLHPDPSTDRALTTTDWEQRAVAMATELRPGAAASDVSCRLDTVAFERLRAAGLTSALVPAEFGGGGATYADMAMILRRLAQGDPAVAVTLAMHSHLVAFQAWRQKHGQDASAVFGKVAAGAMLVSTGAAARIGSSGRAEKVEGGFRVWGRKAPASGAEVGTVLVTSIRWDDAPDGPQVLHCSVPFAADGVSIEQTWDTLGLRATGSQTVVLEDVFVPDAAVSLMRPADVWHPVWNAVLGAAMPLIMSAYAGIADAAVERALAMVQDRTDAPTIQLAGEVLNLHTVGTDLVAAMVASADDLEFANTDEHASTTLRRKTAAAEALVATVRAAIELVGGVGYSRSTDLERLYRDVHGALFHPLPRAKQLSSTGRLALGMSPVG